MTVLGIDVGTSGSRALVLHADGRVVSASADHDAFRSPQTGWAEQDPGDWWRACSTRGGSEAGAGVAMTYVIGAAAEGVAVIATDARLSKQTESGKKVVSDNARKLLRWRMGWFAGAGHHDALEMLLEGLRRIEIHEPEDIRLALERGRQLIIGRLTRKHPNLAAAIDGTSLMLTFRTPEGPRVAMFAPPILGNQLGEPRTGRTLMIPPADVSAADLDEIEESVGTFATGSAEPDERIAAATAAVARCASAIAGRSDDVSKTVEVGVHRRPTDPDDRPMILLRGPVDAVAGCDTIGEFLRFEV